MRSVLLIMAACGLLYLSLTPSLQHSYIHLFSQHQKRKKKSRQGELETEMLKREILSLQEIQSEPDKTKQTESAYVCCV